MGWLARSRAPSTERSGGYIGQPVLTFSDAEPRRDLQTLGTVTAAEQSDDTRPTGKAYHVLERPKTAGGHSKSQSQSYNRPIPQNVQIFNTGAPARLTPPDEGLIGMALGSPTHPPDQTVLPIISPSPLAVYQSNSDGDADDFRHKSGKWKKLGDFFKAKSALAAHNASNPFYSLQPQPASHGTSSPNPIPSPYKVTSTFPGNMGNGVPKKAQHVMGGPTSNISSKASSAGSDRLPGKPSNDGGRTRNPSKTRARSRSDAASRKGATSNKSDKPPIPPAKELAAFQNSSLFLTGLPSLDIEIPDAHMERYSIMFSGVLGDSTSSSLLARRSRMMEKLKMISDEANNTSTEPLPELPPKAKDQNSLMPRSQPRRATSPSHRKEGSFSLFPQPPAANIQAPKGHRLQRSFTAPSGLSPRKETFNSHAEQTINEEETEVDQSPSQISSSTTRPKWSSDHSYLSPASTVSSVNQENDILFDIKALSHLDENDEPQWEIISTDKVHEVDSSAKRIRRPEHKPSPLSLAQNYGQPDGRPKLRGADANDEALAALEAPTPKGQDIAPLKASKAAVDRVMSPPPTRSPPPQSFQPSNNVRKDVVVPKLKVRERAYTNRGSSQTPSHPQSKAPMQPIVTAVANDLEELEQQIESRAVRAMKKQARIRAPQTTDQSAASTPPRRIMPRSATADGIRSESPAAPGRPSMITKVRSVDSIATTMQAQQSRTPPRPTLVRQETIIRQESPLDTVRALSPSPSNGTRSNQTSPSLYITSPQSEEVEVQVARSISVSQRQRQMLVPVGSSRHENDDNLVEKTAQGALTPQIIDAESSAYFGKARGHRHEKSQNAVVESA